MRGVKSWLSVVFLIMVFHPSQMPTFKHPAILEDKTGGSSQHTDPRQARKRNMYTRNRISKTPHFQISSCGVQAWTQGFLPSHTSAMGSSTGFLAGHTHTTHVWAAGLGPGRVQACSPLLLQDT